MNRRPPDNTNLRLTYESFYNGLRVYNYKGPLAINYLESIEQVLAKAMDDYARVLVVRFDLRFPITAEYAFESDSITRFFEALKYQFLTDRKRRLISSNRAHRCTLRYIWCLEQEGSEKPHYHVALVLNESYFGTLGKYRGSETSLACFIKKAWASALNLNVFELAGGVYFVDNASYHLLRNEGRASMSYQDAFYRLSYFAKLKSKHYGDSRKSFNCSRN
jgi:hypothetical protein